MSAQTGCLSSATEVRLHGTHEGKFAEGLAGSSRERCAAGRSRGLLRRNTIIARNADFYRTVKQEEGGKFVLSVVLINKLNSTPTALQKISKSLELQKATI